MTYIVALTGGIGSGKTIISNSFKKKGIHVIDTDIIAKTIVEKNVDIMNNIKKKFGKKILNQDYSINRLKLRKYIFSNKNNKLWLENILHPKIYKESKKQIKLTQSPWCLWVVPLLIEKNLAQQANRILVIDAPIKTQIKRIIIRDKINHYHAKKIISHQISRKQRNAIADDIILNNYTITSKLELHVHYLNNFYTYLSKKNYIIKKNFLTKFY